MGLAAVAGLLAATLFAPGSSTARDNASNASLRIASFNLAYVTPTGGRRDWWLQRRDAAAAAISALDADVIALQEVETFAEGPPSEINWQLDWIVRRFPAYAIAAVGPADLFPSTQPIAFRKDRFQLIGDGFEFHPGQGTATTPRDATGDKRSYTTSAVLRDRFDGRILHVFNPHLSYLNVTLRRRGAAQVAERAGALIARGETVIVAGDLNAIRLSEVGTSLREAGLAFGSVQSPTFHFGVGLGVFPAIDHILHSPDLEVLGQPLLLNERRNGTWPSDHHPIAVDLAARR